MSTKDQNQEVLDTKWIQESESVVEEESNLPPLYSVSTIYIFSIFFSFLIGAVLMFQNLTAVNASKAKRDLIVFSFFYILLMIFVIAIDPIGISGIGMNILGAYLMDKNYWKKYIGVGVSHPSKPIGPAIGLGILFIALTFYLLTVIG